MTVQQMKIERAKGSPELLGVTADGTVWQGKQILTKCVTQSLGIHFLRTAGFIDTPRGWIHKSHIEKTKGQAA